VPVDVGEDAEGIDEGEGVVREGERRLVATLHYVDASGEEPATPVYSGDLDIHAVEIKAVELAGEVAERAAGVAAEVQHAVAGAELEAVRRDLSRDAQEVAQAADPVGEVALAVVVAAVGWIGNRIWVTGDVMVERLVGAEVLDGLEDIDAGLACSGCEEMDAIDDAAFGGDVDAVWWKMVRRGVGGGHARSVGGAGACSLRVAATRRRPP
jgi:hypothetical protein